MKATDETKQKAKAAGIKSWHIKSEEKLQEELGAVEVRGKTRGDVAADDYASRMMDLIDLKGEITWDQLALKCALMGARSKFWPYKDIIDRQLEKMNGN